MYVAKIQETEDIIIVAKSRVTLLFYLNSSGDGKT